MSSYINDINVPEKCAELLRGNGKYFFVCSDCGEIFNDTNSIINHVEIHRSSSSLSINNVKIEVNESAILTEFLTTTIKGEECTIPPHHLEEVYVNDGQNFESSSYVDTKSSDNLCETKLIDIDDDAEYQEIEIKLKKCKLCDNIFENRELLINHQSLAHNIVKKTYECELCNKIFFGPTTFERHFKKIHLNGEDLEIDDKPYKCDLCQKTFRQYNAIKLHVDTKHDDNTQNDLSFTCQYCGKIYEQLNSLESHLHSIHIDIFRRHGIKKEKLRPHICDICFKGFTLTNSLRNHLAVIHGRSDLLDHSYKCEQCGKIFAIKSRLEFHIQRVHNMSSNDTQQSELNSQILIKKRILLVKKEQTKEKPDKKKRIHSAAIRRAIKNENVNCKPKPYKCDVCSRGFSLRNSLKNHLAVVHARDDLLKNSYKCRLCGKIFAILSRLEHHMKKKHEIHEKLSGTRKFHCPRCDITLSSRSTLKMHLFDIHKMDNFSTWNCEICERVFSNKRMLESHINEHKNLREHKCQQCGAGFNNAYKVKAHMMSHNERIFKCTECDFAAKTQRTLDSHTLNIHGEVENRFVCELCAKSFKYKITYDCHMRRQHMGEKPFQCFICGKAYYTSGNLNTHVKHAHSTKIYHCEFTNCGKLFHSELRLKIHLKTHATILRYCCGVCGKKFKTDKTLRQHKLIHDTVKRYKCNYCDMRFTQSSGRRGHERLRHLLA